MVLDTVCDAFTEMSISGPDLLSSDAAVVTEMANAGEGSIECGRRTTLGWKSRWRSSFDGARRPFFKIQRPLMVAIQIVVCFVRTESANIVQFTVSKNTGELAHHLQPRRVI